MCFFPLSCLKGIVGVGATISIVIAIGLLAGIINSISVTFYANLQKKAIVDSISQGIVNTALIGMYIASIIFLILGISGLYGAIKGMGKKSGTARCLMSIYFVGVFIFFLAFLGACIFFMVGPQTIFGADCEKGTQSTLIQNLFAVNKNATVDFCKDNCPCNLNSTNIQSYLAKQLILNDFKNISIDASLTKYQDCANHFIKDKETYALTMATLQQTLNCGGWCNNDKVKFFRFSNINQCTSEGNINQTIIECIKGLNGCYDAFETFMKDKGILIGMGCAAAALIILLNIFTIICICCHPGNRNKSKNFYSRMLDTGN